MNKAVIKKIIPVVSAVLLVVVEIVSIFYVFEAKRTGLLKTTDEPSRQEASQNVPGSTIGDEENAVDQDQPANAAAENDASQNSATQNNSSKKTKQPVDRGNSTVENLPEVPFPIQ